MRLLIAFIVLCSVLFLFGGLMAVGMANDYHSFTSAGVHPNNSYLFDPHTEKYSMKQIDSLSSKLNYNFTSANGLRPENLPQLNYKNNL
jgi:hypothetical protein